MKVETSTINVHRTIEKVGRDAKMLSEHISDQVIAVHKFATEPARVGVDCGLTINLGDYNMAKISVSISVPCYKEEAEEAYNFALAFVESRLSHEKDLIDNRHKGG